MARADRGAVKTRKTAGARRRGLGFRTLEWRGDAATGRLVLLDQTALPGELRYLEIADLDEVIAAIRRLAVRGAPAIGCAAAYGMVIGLRGAVLKGSGLKGAVLKGFGPRGPAMGGDAAFRRSVERVERSLAASRPTAVNLFWALERMRRRALELAGAGGDRSGFDGAALLDALLDEARAIHEEDAALCRAIGDHGEKLIASGSGVLTHCNAGALATGGEGTALAVIYRAAARGKRIRVFADETRPLLQGARLTCWELRRAGIDATLICDGAAASVLASGEVQCVIVGADRITRRGDVANKIGTYGLAVLARHHSVPFYVAAPTTTFDRNLERGSDIPIEERSPEEVTEAGGRRSAPRGIAVRNPAFDVTPAELVTAIITERGVIRGPTRAAIDALLADAAGSLSLPASPSREDPRRRAPRARVRGSSARVS